MDHPEVAGKDEYSVRLLFNVEANSPEHAVARYIDQINEFGNKSWVYRVVKNATGEEFMVHPLEGETYTVEEFEQRMIGADTPEEVAARLGTRDGE